MRPIVTPNKQGDSGLRHAVQRGEFPLRITRRVAMADGHYLFLGQLCHRVLNAYHSRRKVAREGCPTLGIPVVSIISLRSQEQMIRANAGGIIAGMEHAEPIRDGANGKLPCGTRCDDVDAISSYHAVPIGATRGCPQPALLAFLDLLPKPICERTGSQLMHLQPLPLYVSAAKIVYR